MDYSLYKLLKMVINGYIPNMNDKRVNVKCVEFINVISQGGSKREELYIRDLSNGLTVAGNLLSALGFAMLLSSMLSKKMFPYFLLGFLIVAYSGLSLIGVTMFAAILAFILDKVLYGKGANA